MDIIWHGGGCCEIRGEATIVTDPDARYRPSTRGGSVDIVALSQADSRPDLAALGIPGRPFVAAGPGEYESHGVFIIGVDGGAVAAAPEEPGTTGRTHTLYCFDFPGITVCHAGGLRRKPTQAQVEALGIVHVLLLPVGAPDGLEPGDAVEVVNQIDPAIVVPLFDPPVMPHAALVQFLEEMGAGDIAARPTLRVDAGRLPEDPQVYLLAVGEP